MVLVGVVGLGAQHGVEQLAGGAVRGAQEVRLAVAATAAGAQLAAWDRRGGSAGRGRDWESDPAAGPASARVTPGMLTAMPGRKITGLGAAARAAAGWLARGAVGLRVCGLRGRRAGLRLLGLGLGGGRLGRDLAGGRAPIGHHHGRLAARGNERRRCRGRWPCRARSSGRRRGHRRCGRSRSSWSRCARRARPGACAPAAARRAPAIVQRRDHVAGHDRRRRQRHLRALADADKLHGRRRAALGAFAQGRLRHGHHVEALEQHGAAGLGLLDLLLRPWRTPRLRLAPCPAAPSATARLDGRRPLAQPLRARPHAGAGLCANAPGRRPADDRGHRQASGTH